MRKVSTFSSIEILESRIAPAFVFVSSASTGEDALKVFRGDEIAGTSEAEIAASLFGGSDVAVLLTKGDVLVFDADNDHSFSEGDSMLMEVRGGQAMVFLTDFEKGATASAFDRNEITGLVVSDKFRAVIGTDINGSIVTGLGKTGEIDTTEGKLTLQPGSIKSLEIAGQVTGNVLAGGGIKNLSIGTKLVNTGGTDLSIEGIIATGTSASERPLSLNGGSTVSSTILEPEPGMAGGDITNVTLTHGGGLISAGRAIGGEKGKGGDGGSISNVSIDVLYKDLTLMAGGAGKVQAGDPGSGGNVTNVTISGAASDELAIEIDGGFGGLTGKGSGGAGGSVSDISINTGSVTTSVTIQGGPGLLGTSKSGAGGSVTNVELTIQDLPNLTIMGGAGGSSESSGLNGAAGGSVKDVMLVTNGGQADGTHMIGGGSGGSGAKPGAGGGVSNVNVEIPNDGTDAVIGAFTIVGGRGGDGIKNGGNGGAVAHVSFAGSISVEGLEISGGFAGQTLTSKPGKGGAVSNVVMSNEGAMGQVNIGGGAGGAIAQGDGTKFRAGNGGAIDLVQIDNKGSIKAVEIVSGTGGNVFLGAASAGDSGDVSRIAINNTGTIRGRGEIHSGIGGSLQLLSIGNGGDSGDVFDVTIVDESSIENVFHIYAGHPNIEDTRPEIGGPGGVFAGPGKVGSAMAGFGFNSRGGSIGDVTDVKLNAEGDYVKIGAESRAGTGGEFPNTFDARAVDQTGVFGFGGDGGDIRRISGKVGVLDVVAPGGGDTRQGTGGAGGDVSDIDLEVVTSFVRIIAAGDGGEGIKAGAGGSVSNIKVAGDIGDFSVNFGVNPDELRMGGLVAGKGGFGDDRVAGSITNVTADRIAAILAGRPRDNEINYDNAVTSISKITADVIGADLNDPGFNFVEGGVTPGFQPDDLGTPVDGDTALDGFVLVKKNGGGDKLAVTPLKLIQVPGQISFPF